MIEVGKGGQREVEDYQLSRFACYLNAQNGGLDMPKVPSLLVSAAELGTKARELSKLHINGLSVV